MKDLDKVYAESVAKDYLPKETSKVRQLKKLDEKAVIPTYAHDGDVGMDLTAISVDYDR
jgi:hypothetical protein